MTWFRRKPKTRKPYSAPVVREVRASKAMCGIFWRSTRIGRSTAQILEDVFHGHIVTVPPGRYTRRHQQQPMPPLECMFRAVEPAGNIRIAE